MFDLEFDKFFFISTLAMKINRSHPFIKRDIFFVIPYFLITFLVFLTLFVLCHSVFFFDIQNGKYAEASKNGTIIIVCITITLKYKIMLYYQPSIRRLIEIMDDDYNIAKNFSLDDQKLIMSYAKKGVTCTKFWLVCAVTTGAIFPTKAVIVMLYRLKEGVPELVPMFDLTYPGSMDKVKEEPFFFWLYFGLCFSLGMYAASMYVGFDPLVPIFMLHTCGQMDLLRNKMLKLFSENQDSEGVRKSLRETIIKLQSLYDYVDVIGNNFTILYEYNLKSTTFLIPLSAFQIVESLRHNEISYEFISFLISNLLHFFMPCYYSDLLLEKSEEFRQAIYSCGWETRPDIPARRSLVIMLSRASKPMVLSTIFFPICLDTYAEMCRQAYTIFNLMNAACA